jgi:hypothetical protein
MFYHHVSVHQSEGVAVSRGNHKNITAATITEVETSGGEQDPPLPLCCCSQCLPEV